MIIEPVIPLEFLLAALALLGVGLGALVNLAVYRLAWRPRAISPWSAPDPKAPARHGLDFVPVVGWLGLRREGPIHGRGFWIRPLVVELLCGALLAGLYGWESTRPWQVFLAANPLDTALATPNLSLAMHVAFFGHALLALLMVAVSLIDIDDKIIPDALTTPGLLAGLALAALYPWSLPQDMLWQDALGAVKLDFVRLASPPHFWPAGLAGAPEWGSLAIGQACWWLWIGGLLRRRWISRRGWKKAWGWFWIGLLRDRRTRPLAALGGLGSGLIAAAWWCADAPYWAGLLTALVGAAIGGGIVWLVRVIGSATLGREAMGFGDVTLMAMIGAFLGWQASLLVFFLAPFAAIVLGIVKILLRRDQEIPFGPFLCLAAFGVIVSWGWLWPMTEAMFEVKWLLAAATAACLVAMAAMLTAWRWFRAKVLRIG